MKDISRLAGPFASRGIVPQHNSPRKALYNGLNTGAFPSRDTLPRNNFPLKALYHGLNSGARGRRLTVGGLDTGLASV